MAVEVIIALIGIFSGGGLIALINVLTGKTYRAELKEDIQNANKRIDALEIESDSWKKKYFDLWWVYRGFRVKVIQLAIEHNMPADVIKELKHEENKEENAVDKMFGELEKA